MRRMTWKEVLERKDLIGGDIQCDVGGVRYCGRLSAMKQMGDEIHFSSAWVARDDPAAGEWHACEHVWSPANAYAMPKIIQVDTVSFLVAENYECRLFSKDGKMLQSEEVIGLPKDSARLVALYPTLPLDRVEAERIITEMGFRHQVAMLKALPPEAVLKDLLACFKWDSNAEMFLWKYIEHLTGEENVCLKVY